MTARLTRISLTARGAGFLVGSLAVLVFAFYAANVLIVIVAVFLVALVLAELASFGITTYGFGPGAFSAARVECSSLVGVGGTGLASVRVTSRLPRGFFVELLDAYPEGLVRLEGDARLLTWWPAGETLSLVYVVSPAVRGLFDLGPTTVTAHDPLGFAFKSTTLDTPWQVEALPFPSAHGVGYPTRLRSAVLGQTWLSAPGSGTEFRGLRDYEPGDELRHIAWTRSAQGRLYVREYERESQQDLLVLMDVGREMALGVGLRDALERSIQAAASVLRRSFDEGGRGGVAVFSSRVLAVEPAERGAAHEFRVFRTLTGAQIRSTGSTLDIALAELAPILRRPTSLLVFSALGGNLSRLATVSGTLRHAGHRLYVLAPEPRAMFPPLSDPTRDTAFGLLVGSEAQRIERATETLAMAGASVGRFGRDGVVEAVNQVYVQGRSRPEAA
jgi:uncharacterized protein (DUF58 family)